MKRLSRQKALSLFAGYLKAQGFKEGTVRTKKAQLTPFFTFLDETAAKDIRDVKRSDIVSFLSWLQEHPGERGRGYKDSTRMSIFTSVKKFYLCLYENNLVLSSPVETVRFGKRQERMKEVLSEDETCQFLDSIDIHQPLGLRDRTLFELIYSSGLRSSEAAHLDVKDYDPASRLLWIHQSKFSKDRRVPVTKAAAWFLDKYLEGVKASHRPLILSGGYRFTHGGINKRFKLLSEKCGLYRKGLTVHSLRHGCASHLLAHGAEIRYVQELLGHESVETTVVYSRQSEENIKASYRQYHPRENFHFAEVTDSYLDSLESMVRDSLAQREKNRKALARRMSK